MNTPLEREPIIRVRSDDALELVSRLDEAIDALLPEALARGDRGILVTRLSGNEYTAALDPSVPFGTTQEQCSWTPRRTSVSMHGARHAS